MYPMQYGTLHHRRESALKAMSHNESPGHLAEPPRPDRSQASADKDYIHPESLITMRQIGEGAFATGDAFMLESLSCSGPSSPEVLLNGMRG